MQKKFLFPIIFLIVFGVLFLVGSEGLLFILMTPMNLIILAIEVNSGASQGTLTSSFYPALLGGIIQYFFVGWFWDGIVKYFKNRTHSGE